MKFTTLLFVILLKVAYGQDTIFIPFGSEYHLKNDSRNFTDELENCVVFIPNFYHTSLVDGNYVFFDSITQQTRSEGIVLNGVKHGKWLYYDSSGVMRIEDIFMNDVNLTLVTNYYNSNEDLFRTKESSTNYLRTIHYNQFGMESYYYQDYLDSANTQMSFDSLGRIIYQSSTYKGKKHGIFQWHYNDGTLYAKHYYLNGNKEGTWVHGFEGDSTIWCIKEYSNDKLNSISFYGKTTLILDKGEQQIVDYYENGNKRLIGMVKDGYIVGDWLFFDIEGNQVAKFKHDDTGNITIQFGSLNVPGI